ncbi:hypothetical protein QW131_01945 [Roseibium salinum]|nr:hypothetical protein [Roseibium salinum]
MPTQKAGERLAQAGYASLALRCTAGNRRRPQEDYPAPADALGDVEVFQFRQRPVAADDLVELTGDQEPLIAVGHAEELGPEGGDGSRSPWRSGRRPHDASGSWPLSGDRLALSSPAR